MAEPYLFIERLDGKPVNVSLLQTVGIDPEDDTNVIWTFTNGEAYIEDLVTSEEANNRLANIKGLLLGTTIADLEERVTEQQNTIGELNTEIETATISIIDINGETIPEQSEGEE